MQPRNIPRGKKERTKVMQTMMSTSQDSSDRSRTKLLNRLGLFQHPPSLVAGVHGRQGIASSFLTSISRDKRSVLGSYTPVKVQLKECRSDSETSELATTSRRGPAVQFDSMVSVVHIPSRNQYSPRIKKHIWADSVEIMEMAERNMIEFEHEGFDWRSVVLEDDMYVDSYNGDLIHPCHLDDDSFLISGGNIDGGIGNFSGDGCTDVPFQPLKRSSSFLSEESKLC